MKNFIILGLLAALLFTVSAAMSVWLNQSKQSDASAEKKDEKPAAKGPKSDGPKETTDTKDPKSASKTETPPPGPESGLVAVKKGEEELKNRAERLELVVRDLQVQREKTDAVLAAVTNELKKVPAEVSRLDALARDLKDKQLEIDKGEQKNIDKIGTMYDAMSPEAAAPSFQKMVDEGKVDFAAKILNQMKERNASRILEALEPSVALMILERMRNIRPAAKTP
ncbi:MAG: MotE family protein [Gemmata sp.]